MPTPVAAAFLDEQGQVFITGHLEGPYKRLREISEGRRMGGAALDLITTEQAEEYATARAQEALAAAADAIAYNIAACEDRVTGLLLRANEQAVRSMAPASGPGGKVMIDDAWNPPETAPRDRTIIVDVGWPWASVGHWNDSMQRWIVADLQWSQYRGKADPSWITETELVIKGWKALPLTSLQRTARP